MADDNKSGVDKGAETTKAATNRAAEQGHDVARKGAETMQRNTDAATDATRELTGQAAHAAGDMRNQVVELWREQARLNVEAMQQLTTAVDWQRVTRSRPTTCAPAASGWRSSVSAGWR